jgi:uncharacterized protein involved in outer membrane biogenesis
MQSNILDVIIKYLKIETNYAVIINGPLKFRELPLLSITSRKNDLQ